MTPIPENARHDDPCWGVAYLELAHGMVRAGAKARIIARYTGLPLSRIRAIYRALLGVDPPSGALVQGSPKFFTRPGKHTSESWTVQTAIFLACYERTGNILPVPAHRGWRLLAAHTAYLALTQPLHESGSIQRLSINQAYALLTHCAFMTDSDRSGIRIRECPNCLLHYAAAVTSPLSEQRCPVCAIHINVARLEAQIAPFANRVTDAPRSPSSSRRQSPR